MNIRILTTLYLLCCFLLPVPTAADSDGSSPEPMSCDFESIKGNNHLQYGMESWFTNERRENEEYQERIKQIESSDGVFSYKLVPELIGVGMINQEQANQTESSNAFKRALHIIRVNDGLYSTRQLPIIDLVIKSSTALQEWKQVANNYDLMYWLYRRNFAEDDPRQLQTLKRLRRWYMESYNKDTGRSLKDLFDSSEKLYDQALSIMWSCTNGNKREALCFWHKTCCADADATLGICPFDRG